MFKTIEKGNFNTFVKRLIEKYRVEAPQTKGGKFAFNTLKNVSNLRLDHDVTILPPKKYFMPQVETILSFDKQEYTPNLDNEKFILLGVHPYDIYAFNVLDKLFEQNNPDAHYAIRRKNITVIGCDIINTSSKAFWSSMGTGTVDNGFDLMITDCDSYYVIQISSDNGKNLLNEFSINHDSSNEEIQKRNEVRKNLFKQFSGEKLDYPIADLSKRLEKSYDSSLWKKNSATCYSCGSCNLVCPTCYCFDVRDEIEFDLQRGQRQRCWDGCLLEDFASVMGGKHNFRKNKEDRYRHRYFRKGFYIYQKIGLLGCVGCGRCTINCVPDIANPVTIYNQLSM